MNYPPIANEEIEKIAKPFLRACGDHWCYEIAIPEDNIEDFVRAIETAIKGDQQ